VGRDIFDFDADGFRWLANAFQQRDVGRIGFGERILHTRNVSQPEERVAGCFDQLRILKMDHQAMLNAVGKMNHKKISFVSGNRIAFGTDLEKQETVVITPHFDLLLGLSRKGR
jgi:hypothetical protein